MPSLHDVTQDTKALVKWGIVALIGIIVISITFNALRGTLFKPKVDLPAQGFGALPAIPFPSPAVQQPLTYQLETIDGKPSIIDPTTNQPKFIPDRINVYKIATIPPNLLNLQNAENKVAAAGFTDTANPQQISDIVYSWNSNTGLSKTLTMDITSSNFHLTSNYLNYPAVLSASNVPSDITAIALAQNFLIGMQVFPADIDPNLTTALDYVIVNNVIRLASPGENVMAVRVNFNQKAVDGYSIFYPNFPNSTMSILFTGGDNNAEVADATFVHQIIDASSSSTYPLKTSVQAYADLQSGKAYIAPSFSGTTNDVQIKTVNLGYYLGESSQLYLMPVYVFQGDNNFTGYVSAIADSSIASQPSLTAPAQ